MLQSLCNMAYALGVARDYEGVAEAWEDYLRHAPASPVALRLRANALQDLGRPDRALALLRQAVGLAPDYILAWGDLFHLLFNQDSVCARHESLAILTRLTAWQPHHPEYRELAAYCHAAAGRLDLAESYARQADACQSPVIRTQEAVAALTQEISLDPLPLEPWLVRLFTYPLDLDHRDLALADLASILRRHPRCREAREFRKEWRSLGKV